MKTAILMTHDGPGETQEQNERGPLERAFGEPVADGVVSLPGVMSCEKQVAPKLLGAAAR